MKHQDRFKIGDLVELEPIVRLVERYTQNGPEIVTLSEPTPAILIDVKTYSGESLGTTFEEYTFLLGESTVLYEHIDDRRLPFRKM